MNLASETGVSTHNRKVRYSMSLSSAPVPAFDPALASLRSLVVRGRYTEADRLVRAQRHRLSRAPHGFFLELRAEIALGLGRFGDALDWAGQARVDAAEALRFSIERSRIRALLGLGRFRDAQSEVESRFVGLDPAGLDLSLFRGQLALHSGRLNDATKAASDACAKATSARRREKLVEALMLRARAARETGNADGARCDLDRALRLSNGLRDTGVLAAVLSDRADLMAYCGHWTEAERDAGQSGRLFARSLSAHEHLSAGRRTGLLGLAQGDHNLALPSLERAAGMARRGFGTAISRAEIDLLFADAQILGRDPEGALERATSALSFFRHAQDPGGLARAHVRRSLAALSASNLALAFREAKKAMAIEGAGPVAAGLADLALGRVLLRRDRPAAGACFARAAGNHSLYPPLRSVAQLGVSLSSGASPKGDAVRQSLGSIEGFGDRRIMAIVRGDLLEVFGEEPASMENKGLHGLNSECGPGPRPESETETQEFLPGLIGASKPVCHLGVLVRKAASSGLPVSIYGETGTGKEKIAEAIHDFSPRSGGKFVAINAADYSDELFESEIFGHARGSFTGAHADRLGLIEAAKGGTLFIDEVAELSLHSQARLLRVVQNGTYRRVGENHERRADVRIVVAANQKLEDLVLAQRFRADLLYRLRGIGLTVPPLRERGTDVVRLARHFVGHASSGAKTLSPQAEVDLRAYAWPGNVRELEQEMRRAVVFADSSVIQWKKPPAQLPSTSTNAAVVEALAGPSPSLHQALMSFERTFLKSALSQCSERVEAARLLGISRQALHQKILRLGL